jgi:hypothetical protein
VVERGPEKAGVGGSIPSLATTFQKTERQSFRPAYPSRTPQPLCAISSLFSFFLFSRHPDLLRYVPDRPNNSPTIV